MSGSVIIRGYNPVEGAIDILADRIGHSVISQGPEHEMTHQGKHFLLAHYFADIDTDGYGRIRFKTPTDQYLHAIIFSVGTLGHLRTFYRSPGFTHNASNAIVAVNRNDSKRLEITDPIQEACHTPSGSGAGTVFIPTLPIGGAGFFTAGPGENRDANEIDLDLDTTYLLEVQSLNDNNRVCMGVDFYYRDEN